MLHFYVKSTIVLYNCSIVYTVFNAITLKLLLLNYRKQLEQSLTFSGEK